MIENFISCNCGNEVLRVTVDDDKEVLISIFSYDVRSSFLNRIRAAWGALRGRFFPSDMVIISKEEAEEFFKEVLKDLK